MLTILCLFFFCVNCTFSLIYSGHCNISLSMKGMRCDCSSRDLTFIPTECPRNTSELYLANNDLGVLGKETFTRYIQLSFLDISNSNITSIDQSAFNNLTQLKEPEIFK